MNVSIKGKILNYTDLETDLGYEGDKVFVSQLRVFETSVKYFLKNTIWVKKLFQFVKKSSTFVWLQSES